jgi:hypothetical protein
MLWCNCQCIPYLTAQPKARALPAAYTYSLPRYMPPTKDAGDAPRFDIKQPVQPELRNIQPTRPASYNPKTDVWLDDWIM